MRPIPRIRTIAAVTAAVIGVQLLTLQSGCAAPVHNPATTAPEVIAATGKVNPTAYRALANSFASSEGVVYRFGNAATTARSASTVWQRPSKPFLSTDMAQRRTYEVGGPQNPALGDYSSNQGQVGYLASSAPTSGVDAIETLSMDQGTFSQKPRLSWTYYGGGHPDPSVLKDTGAGRCIAKSGRPAGRLVAEARAYAHGEATANAVLVFDNGVISTAGTNTAPGEVCAKLPSDLRATDVSVTNGNEFALVTAWNVKRLRSELVVVALGGRQPAGQFSDFEWPELYPGFRNYGRPTFIKVLGSIVLPMKAATTVSAVSDVSTNRLNTANGSLALPGQLPLSNEANRQSFISGVNRAAVASAGYAVVASREEKKVAFVDLQPLFQSVTRAYLGSRSQFDAAIGSIGQKADQWPYAFSAAAKEQPVVVKTITTSSAPSSVAGMLSGSRTPRAYVGTTDGHLLVFSVNGLASTAAVAPAAIRQVGSITVGNNPTDITYVKDRDTGSAVKQSLDDTLIVTARQSRAVQWVRLKGDGGSVIRTLRDSRMADPIASEDNNTHGTESYVVTVADFAGNAVRNYRYGPVVFHTNGGAVFQTGENGSSTFEYGGAYSPGGRPFTISITNVT